MSATCDSESEHYYFNKWTCLTHYTACNTFFNPTSRKDVSKCTSYSLFQGRVVFWLGKNHRRGAVLCKQFFECAEHDC